jgi:hypothetical protein
MHIGGRSSKIFMSDHYMLSLEFIVTASQLSIQKRWSYIQQKTNKFYGTIDNVVSRPVSDLGVADGVMHQPFLYQSSIIRGYAYQKHMTNCIFVDSSYLGLLEGHLEESLAMRPIRSASKMVERCGGGSR